MTLNITDQKILKMFHEGRVPIRGGVWIDVYSRLSNTEISGTITTRISASNCYYVSEISAD